MFASLSSLLPPVLLLSQPARSPDPLSPPPTTPAPAPAPAVDPPRKKEKKEKHANEAFIIVRPPPSKSTQPLSLQVQLVPPQSRQDKPVQALDTSPEDLDTDLKRTQSNRSETSDRSSYTANGSVSSLASTSTSTASSGRRMIIPLYNLNVHSVTPTTISDAGTDAKVAKFAKRGLEVIGLAFLEPIEVRPSLPTNGPPGASITARPSLDGSLREFGAVPALSPPFRPATPDRPTTALSTMSTSADHPFKPSINVTLAPPLPPTDLQPQRSSKKLFSRMFRRKDPASPLSIAVHAPDETTPPQPPPSCNIARRSDELPASRPDTPLHHDASLASTTVSQTAVLGVYPTLYPSVSNPTGRPTKYVWVVRKWLKGTDTSLFNGMMGKLSVGGRDATVSHAPHIELRFEWARGQKATGHKSRADKRSNSRESHSPSGSRTPNNATPRIASQTLSANAPDPRSSIISHNSSGSDSAASVTSSGRRHAEESDEESDPEDSETPWTCTVAVQRLGRVSQHHQNGVRDSPIRLKAATLAPTPHHPKVVGLLKVPFPLPDIELERVAIRRRLVTPQGISKTTTSPTTESVLTAEEIKDTISSTALWLVVREAFGGVGRERKKGKS